MRRLSDFPDQGEDGKTFETKEETARLSRPSRRRRDSEKKSYRIFPERGGDEAAQKTARLEIQKRDRLVQELRDEVEMA